MRKLSKITESVWGDIRKKSLGQESRGEDEWVIDLMKQFITRHPMLKEGEYEISDLKLNLSVAVRIDEEDLVDGKLPFKFGKVYDFVADNIGLVSLENSPDEVENDFVVNGNELTNFIGGPKKVGRTFTANFNKNLESLDGSPDEVGNYSIIGCRRVKDIKGITPVINKEFRASEEAKQTPPFTDDDYRKYSDIRGQIVRRF